MWDVFKDRQTPLVSFQKPERARTMAHESWRRFNYWRQFGLPSKTAFSKLTFAVTGTTHTWGIHVGHITSFFVAICVCVHLQSILVSTQSLFGFQEEEGLFEFFGMKGKKMIHIRWIQNNFWIPFWIISHGLKNVKTFNGSNLFIIWYDTYSLS